MVIMQYFHSEGSRLVGAVRRRPLCGMSRREMSFSRSAPVYIARPTRGSACGKNLKPSSLSASRLNQKGSRPTTPAPPKDPMYFADFCARTIERSAPRQQHKAAA
jgi:hypothetical protein